MAKPYRYSASTSRSGFQPPGSREGSPSKIQPRAENTYRLEPSAAFPVSAVRAVLQDVLQSNLQEKTYSATDCGLLARDLAGIVRNRVRALQCTRYKLVVTVTVGEKVGPGASSSRVASRCVWNDKYDTHVDYICENATLYAVGVVYGVYVE